MEIIKQKLNNKLENEYLIKDNILFKMIDDSKLHRKEICYIFIPFYHAVKYWIYHLKILASNIENNHNDIGKNIFLIKDNIDDEAGNGKEEDSHTNTYLQFLEVLGIKEYNFILYESNSVKDFNDELSKLFQKTIVEHLYTLGTIEFYYIYISSYINKNLSCYFNGEQKHYNNHEILDVKHSEDFFKLSLVLSDLEPELLDNAIDNGFKLLYNLYEGLLDHSNSRKFLKSPIYFAQVREDPQVELNVINDNDKILMIASGGDTLLSILNEYNSVDIDLIDLNKNQLYLTEMKRIIWSHFDENKLEELWFDSFDINSFINIINKIKTFIDKEEIIDFFKEYSTFFTNGLSNSGRFEALFDLVRQQNDNYNDIGWDIWFKREILMEVFGENAVKYSMNHEFNDHFKLIYSEYLKLKSDGSINYFIDQVLFKDYTFYSSYPLYFNKKLMNNINYQLKYINSDIFQQLKESENEKYNMIHISNITDWLPPDRLEFLLSEIVRCLKFSGKIILRRLNSDQKLDIFVEKFFQNVCYVSDKSHFYTECIIGEKLHN